MKRIFIDGSSGTTGLRIHERLAKYKDIELVKISEEDRKDLNKRIEIINSCDVAFLCLPDDAAKEIVSKVSDDVIIIDTSTAHRTDPSFAYGFLELGEKFLNDIKNKNRIAVPGCHASGFIALIYPLVEKGLISKDTILHCFSLTGYSGGGKKMISEYESDERSPLLKGPRQYGLNQMHKHLKEMKAICKLENEPVFSPIVCDFYSGMQVSVMLSKNELNGTIEDIKNVYKEKYNKGLVSYSEDILDNGFISSAQLSNMDNMKVAVYGNDERIILVSVFDNLGKGASGSAIECLNVKLNRNFDEGLNV